MSTNSKIKINLDSLKARREWKRHKVNLGHNTFRFLPPFGEEANGYPYRKWQVIWGLVDPQSGRMRPFASSMTTEKKCPVLEYVTALQAKAETIKSDLKAKGTSDEDIKESLKGINSLISNLRPKTVFAYNAANKAGEVAILELKTTAHKKVKDLFGEFIRDYAQDPTSLNSESDDSGVWFDVIRQGTGFDTEYDVKKLQTKVKTESGFAYADDRSALPASIVADYESMAYNLSQIYQIKTYDELKEILLANLPLLIKEVPEALIDGFTPSSTPVTVGTTSSNGTKPTVVVPNKEAFKTNKVNLRLNDEDDTEEVPQTKSVSKVANIDDDLMAQAESLLNDD